MEEMIKRGVQCFGPYPADGFMGSGNYRYFDGILAMYHDQGLAPFKALAMDEGSILQRVFLLCVPLLLMEQPMILRVRELLQRIHSVKQYM